VASVAHAPSPRKQCNPQKYFICPLPLQIEMHHYTFVRRDIRCKMRNVSNRDNHDGAKVRSKAKPPKPNQTKPNQTKPNQTKPNQTKPNQTSSLTCLPPSRSFSADLTSGLPLTGSLPFPPPSCPPPPSLSVLNPFCRQPDFPFRSYILTLTAAARSSVLPPPRCPQLQRLRCSCSCSCRPSMQNVTRAPPSSGTSVTPPTTFPSTYQSRIE
jgi:hypothetical protein